MSGGLIARGASVLIGALQVILAFLAIAILGSVLIVIALFAFGHFTARPALGQAHDHGKFHEEYYRHWVSRGGVSCCDNRDCGTLASENERDNGDSVEVRIDGMWCPVLPKHYLRSGNAPNWASSHVCISPAVSGFAPVPYLMPRLFPCDRLRCYQPKPQG